MSREFDSYFVHLEEPANKYFQELPPLKDFETQPNPFMMVLPSGLSQLERIKGLIEQNGLAITGEHSIKGFEILGRYIYPVVQDKPHSYAWLMLNRYLFGEKADEAYIYMLQDSYGDEKAYTKVDQVKRHVRSSIGIKSYSTLYRNQTIPVRLHHLHAPDFSELRQQYNAILNFTKK